MSAVKLAENIFSVGVQNPDLKIFDIIMQTEFGTTYNSYLIKDQKTVLIETVHTDFFDEFKHNLSEITPIEQIDYLIMNHNEPDHSGSIKRLLELNPDITVVTTLSGKKFISEITNQSCNFLVVKDNDTLNIGSMTLTFVIAPFLHWPDSMFTVIKDRGIAFTCDFLGAHFCSDEKTDPQGYKRAFRYYYDCIFSPFKPYVLAGLDKLEPYSVSMVCPSHGPVLTDSLSRLTQLYREWSKIEQQPKTVAVPYASAYGYSKMLAQAAARGVKKAGVEAVLYDLAVTDPAQAAQYIEKAQAVIIASCTINQDAPPPVWLMLSHVCPITNKTKPAGVVGSYGWSGEAVSMIRERLTSLKFRFVGDGMKINFKPTQEELTAAEEYGLQIAQLIK